MVEAALIDKLIRISTEAGVFKAQVIPVRDIFFDEKLRSYCEANACGMYGMNHTCPPAVGDICGLIQEAQSFEDALVFQTVYELEDSFDFEGMQTAMVQHSEVSEAIDRKIKPLMNSYLQLGAGGCTVCERCTKVDDEPCRFPDRAVASLEAYGIDTNTFEYIPGFVAR